MLSSTPCFAKAEPAQPAEAESSDGDPTDSNSYIKRVSKWVGKLLKAVVDPKFWVALHIKHWTREPIIHLHRWLQKEALSKSDSTMFELVFSKVDGIGREFDCLLHSAALSSVWHEVLCFCMQLGNR